MDEKTLDIVEKTPDKDKYWKVARECIKEGLLYLAVFFVTFLLFIFFVTF